MNNINTTNTTDTNDISTTIDMKNSFFVGDAAGRKQLNDFADTDRKFAINVGCMFYTPEEYFLNINKEKFQLTGFDPFQFDTSTTTIDENININVNKDINKQEIVLFVGLPASGKSFYYQKYFSNYIHINQDTLKTKQKCLNVLKSCLKDGSSCVIGNNKLTHILNNNNNNR